MQLTPRQQVWRQQMFRHGELGLLAAWMSWFATTAYTFTLISR